MASCDDPNVDNVLSPEDGVQQESNVGDQGIVSVGEGRFPRPNPDLRPNSPSFVHETSFAYGTPSGEVLFRRPSRYEHVGEPAQDSHSLFNTHFQARNKEIDDLRKQISSIQSSLSAIASRLDSQSIGPESLSVPQGQPPIRSASVPSHFQQRTSMAYDINDVNDRYSMPSGRERSLSPHRYAASTGPDYATAMSAPISVNNRYRSKESYIKVAIYDGKTSWKDYLVQFELAAQENGWDRHTRAIRLACSLRGSAQALLSDLTPDIRQNYSRLVTTLTERFEPQNQCEIYKAQLKQRIRRRDEALPELAQDIKRLTRMAYPSAFVDLRDTLSKDSFIEALNDADMELFICQKEPETIDDAVRLALKYEAFTQGRRKRLSSSKTGVRMQYEDEVQNVLSRNDIEEIKNEIRELKISAKVQPNQGKPAQGNQDNIKGACYGCGQTDHMVRSCPFKGNAGSSSRYNGRNNHQNRSGYRNAPRNDRSNAQQNNPSTESTVNSSNAHRELNSRRNGNQGNYQKLMPRVKPQL